MLIAQFIDMLVGIEFIVWGLIVLVFQTSMAKVATAGPLSSNSIRFGGVSGKVEAGVKRKTPSELRVSFWIHGLALFSLFSALLDDKLGIKWVSLAFYMEDLGR